MVSQGRQHTGKYLQPEILLVTQSVGAPLDDADLVVESLDEAKGDLVLGSAIGGDPFPMTLDHCGELLVGFQALPLETGLPILEETPCPAFALVAPQLAEGLLEQVGGVQPLVGCQQGLEGLPAVQGQVLPAAQQDIFLALEVAPFLALKPGVFGLAHLVQGVVEVPHDVKLVEQGRSLRRPLLGGVAKRRPHVHYRQPDAADLLLAQPVIELVHGFLRAILAPEPQGPASDQIAHHDAIGVALANRDLVDTDGLGRRCAGPRQLGCHVLLVQRFDGMPVQAKFLGDGSVLILLDQAVFAHANS